MLSDDDRLQASTEQQQTSEAGGHGTRYGMTAGGQVREEELMQSLQLLLEKVEKGQFSMPGNTAQWNFPNCKLNFLLYCLSSSPSSLKPVTNTFYLSHRCGVGHKHNSTRAWNDCDGWR